MRLTRNQVNSQGLRGFKSLPHRQLAAHIDTDISNPKLKRAKTSDSSGQTESVAAITCGNTYKWPSIGWRLLLASPEYVQCILIVCLCMQVIADVIAFKRNPN
jgi:hypothetical protein